MNVSNPFQMFFRYMFANKLLTNLSPNLCHRYLRRFVNTKPRVYEKQKDKNDFLLYIDDQNTAQLVAKHVNSSLAENEFFIFEACPGPGLLTEQLLKTRAQSVRVFEENSIFLNKLKELQSLFPNRLQIIEKQLINFKAYIRQYPQLYEEEMSIWFRDIPVRDWRCLPHIVFVTVLSPKNSLFLRYIMKLLMNKELFFSYGRTQLLVFISEHEHKYMTAKPAIQYSLYRSSTVLFNTLFDIDTLETVDYKQFGVYPTDNDLQKASNKKPKGNAKLVRLTPKLYLDQMDAQTLNDYFYFVFQTFMKRKNYVIPFLENWFPNCGPDLINRGIPVFKYFGDLTPEEVLDLFTYFHNRSDFQKLYKELEVNDSLDFDGPDVKDFEELDIKDKTED